MPPIDFTDQHHFFMTHHTRTHLRSLAALTLLVPSVYTLNAANNTWSGNTDANLATAANWSLSPTLTTNTWVFGAAGTSGTTLNNNLTANLSVAGITYNSGTSTTVSTAASSGVSSITLTSTTGIAVGQSISGAGIALGSTVTSIAGNTVNLSQPTTAAIAAKAAIGYNGGAYTLGGNAITLTSNIQLNAGAANQVINLNMAVNNATPRSITTVGNALTLGGVISTGAAFGGLSFINNSGGSTTITGANTVLLGSARATGSSASDRP